MSAEAPTQAPPRRRELAVWLVGLLALTGVLVGTVVAMGGRVEAATWGLVVAAAAMVFVLHSLYRMVTVLSRPGVEVVLEQDDVAALAGVRELREEKRRILRAINELQFDYEMGKLSDEDYQTVRQGYQLRAVEVMRALDQRPRLHPQLEQELRKRGVSVAEAADEDAADDDVADDDVADEDVADEDVADEDVADEGAADEGAADEDKDA
ncbi:MAG: hypothetical protein AAGF11_37320 [Myxococcota bacterium]